MGKRKKEHRKRVQARNRKIETARSNFNRRFQEELLKHIESQKAQQNGGNVNTTEVEEVVSEIVRVNPENEPDSE